MATIKKETKSQKFARLLALSQVQADPTLVEFIQHEQELLESKRSSEKKPTKAQVENKAIKTSIVEGMEVNRMYSISEIQKEVEVCADLSCQKVASLMTQLITEGKVERTMEKRKPFYSLKG